jgi:hypothetical protein
MEGKWAVLSAAEMVNLTALSLDHSKVVKMAVLKVIKTVEWSAGLMVSCLAGLKASA